jgi:phosphatidate phosphatase APP1
MLDVLHQLIDRVAYRSESEVRAAHTAVDEWFQEHFPSQPADSTVDNPAPGASVTAATSDQGDHSA